MCNKAEKYINVQTGEELDLEKVKLLKDNAMLKVKPELWIEWDFEKNDGVYDIWEMTKGMGKKVTWRCITCGESYPSFIYSKTLNNRGCSFCSGRRANHNNSLAKLRPKEAHQWHPSKNGDLTPHDVTAYSNKKVWWQCKLGHEWETTVNSKSTGVSNGCPYCSNQKVLKGFNDMWTTNPELAKLLADPEDGYKYTQGSDKMLAWKCHHCNKIFKNKRISTINKYGLSCASCSNKSPYPEKFMSILLYFLNIEYHTQYIPKWSDGKRYDFYIPSINTIIETHGIQHYEQSTRKNSKSLREEQLNDNYKRKIAINNGVEDYIIIDCKYSDFDYIKKSILNSRLSEIFELEKVDFDNIKYFISKSTINNVSDMYKKGISILEIADITKISSVKIKNFLKIGIKDFDVKKTYNLTGTKKKIVNVDKGLYFNTIKDACEYYNVSITAISNNLNRRSKSAGGYRWMYEEDYEKYIEEQGKLA